MSRVLFPAAILAFLLVRFLQAGVELPPGAGREIVLNRCGNCHEVDAAVSTKYSEGEWRKKVDKMIDRGAEVSDDEYQPLVAYLVANFGKK